jgi:isopenicillin N synthase-like dioxygenase
MISKTHSPETSEGSIQVIDISPWLNPSSTTEERTSVLEALRFSCTTHGFFSLIGHGIPLQLQQDVLQCAQNFFALSMEEKTSVSMQKSMGQSNRGYEVLQGQKLQPGALPDLKEVRAASEVESCGKP